MDNVKQVRESWYRAYKEGDTESLRRHESEQLVVTINGCVEFVNRYDLIDQKISTNSWFQPELEKSEVFEEAVSEWVVHGEAKILESKNAGNILTYKEIWKAEGGVFKIISLEINT